MKIQGDYGKSTRMSIEQASKKTTEQMSSGRRINRAADDPANLAVSEKMISQARGARKEVQNLQDRISFNQTRDGALSGTQDIVGRMRELSVQAANSILTPDDRQVIQKEVNMLREQVDMNAAARFNSKPVAADAGRDDLGLNELNVIENPQAAIRLADEASRQVSKLRANTGAETNRLIHEVRGKHIEMENTIAAESRVRDTDFAESSIQKAITDVKEKVNLNMIQKTNLNRQNVLQLVQ